MQLASQLRQAQKMESLGHLTGGVAHDFNNLLAVILGNSEILYEEINDPELKETAELVMTTAEKGADLTQRLLAFGRRQALHPELLDLGAVIGSLSDMLNRTLGNQVRLETHSTAEQLAYVDRGLFESAVLNLALNARDAMPNGGLLTITTEVVHCDGGQRRRARSRRLRKGHRHRYRRGHEAGDPRPGLRSVLHDQGRRQGLRHGPLDGLRLCQAVRRPRHHREQARTRAHRCTSICRSRTRPKRSSRSSYAQDLPAACGHERILLVEDEPHVRRFVSNQLTGLGYSVLEAEAGAPALEILRKEQQNIDLLFTDLLMPGGMSGFDLVKHAREFLPALKVLLTTGYAAETDSMLADVKEVILKKPYKKQQLAQALRSVLEQASLIASQG